MRYVNLTLSRGNRKTLEDGKGLVKETATMEAKGV